MWCLLNSLSCMHLHHTCTRAHTHAHPHTHARTHTHTHTNMYIQAASALGVINVNWRQLKRVAERRVTRLASEAGLSYPSNSVADQVTTV